MYNPMASTFYRFIRLSNVAKKVPYSVQCKDAECRQFTLENGKNDTNFAHEMSSKMVARHKRDRKSSSFRSVNRGTDTHSILLLPID